MDVHTYIQWPDKINGTVSTKSTTVQYFQAHTCFKVSSTPPPQKKKSMETFHLGCLDSLAYVFNLQHYQKVCENQIQNSQKKKKKNQSNKNTWENDGLKTQRDDEERDGEGDLHWRRLKSDLRHPEATKFKRGFSKWAQMRRGRI